jgi:hypothetical protein
MLMALKVIIGILRNLCTGNEKDVVSLFTV